MNEHQYKDFKHKNSYRIGSISTCRVCDNRAPQSLFYRYGAGIAPDGTG